MPSESDFWPHIIGDLPVLQRVGAKRIVKSQARETSTHYLVALYKLYIFQCSGLKTTDKTPLSNTILSKAVTTGNEWI